MHTSTVHRILLIAVMIALPVSTMLAEPVEEQAEKPVVETPTIVDGNVWTTEDGTKYFSCPVMKGEGLVSEADAATVLDGVRYYHCCPPCQGPFRAESQKYLEGFAVPGNVIQVNEQGVKHFRDPVNGKEGKVFEETPFIDHDGQRYYFSKKKTMKKFSKAPEEYLSKAG